MLNLTKIKVTLVTITPVSYAGLSRYRNHTYPHKFFYELNYSPEDGYHTPYVKTGRKQRYFCPYPFSPS